MVNCGDGYDAGTNSRRINGGDAKQQSNAGAAIGRNTIGLPSGSRLGLPHRLAFALVDDGWLWRDEVVWHKPAPMPESMASWRWERCRVKVAAAPKDSPKYDNRNRADVGYMATDGSQDSAQYAPCPGCPRCAPNDGYVLRRGSWRTTDAHEFCLVFAKRMGNYADKQAVEEAGGWDMRPANRLQGDEYLTNGIGQAVAGASLGTTPATRNPRSVQRWATEPLPQAELKARFGAGHFAAFPTGLPAFFIRAYTPERGCCAECGAPWARCVEREAMVIDRTDNHPAELRTMTSGTMVSPPSSRTLGWRPTCAHAGDPIPSTVLDCFSGSGSTAIAAHLLGRSAIGIELNPRYIDLAKWRLERVKRNEDLPGWYADGREIREPVPQAQGRLL